MTAVLFGHKDSGHCYKIVMAARYANIEYRPVYVDIFAPAEQRPEEFLRASQYREVPTWVEDGRALAQSNAILLHLARKAPQLLGGCDNHEQAQIEQWLFWEMSRLNLGIANYREMQLFSSSPDPAISAHYRQRSTKALEQLNAHMANRSFLLDRVTIADFSCASYLLLLDGRLFDLTEWPHVARWLDRLRADPKVMALDAFLREFSAM
jgi:glutathione S-transferase